MHSWFHETKVGQIYRFNRDDSLILIVSVDERGLCEIEYLLHKVSSNIGLCFRGCVLYVDDYILIA
jgi:hypothetical protein